MDWHVLWNMVHTIARACWSRPQVCPESVSEIPYTPLRDRLLDFPLHCGSLCLASSWSSVFIVIRTFVTFTVGGPIYWVAQTQGKGVAGTT